jgi:hypothetical protein
VVLSTRRRAVYRQPRSQCFDPAHVHGPIDAGYDGARRIWNGLLDRRPALILQCTGAADVIVAVTSRVSTTSCC